ncbi:MAG: hypothetical protein HRF47_14110 [Chloroflexota bacterium]|jgi:hypothetical protein
MKLTKKQTVRLFQSVENWGVLIVPFISVLLIGILARSWETGSVVQAESIIGQSNLSAQDIADKTSALGPFQADEIPDSSFAISVANGINFFAGNYRLDTNGKLAIDFCFDQIDTGDWMIWVSSITDKQGLSAAPSGGELLEIRFPPILIDGKPKQQIMDFRGETASELKDYYIDADPNQRIGQRCVTMTYNLPQKFDLSNFTVTVDSIVAYPDENTQCSEALLLKIQKKLNDGQIGIKVKMKTETSDGGGVCGFEITQKPEDMSFEEAMSIINGNEMIIDLYGIRGPWIFEGNVK